MLDEILIDIHTILLTTYLSRICYGVFNIFAMINSIDYARAGPIYGMFVTICLD